MMAVELASMEVSHYNVLYEDRAKTLDSDREQ